MKHETLVGLFKKKTFLSCQSRWIRSLLVMITLLAIGLGSSASRFPARPLSPDYPGQESVAGVKQWNEGSSGYGHPGSIALSSRVTEAWRTRLDGGWSSFASPAVADIRPDYPGLEIAVGTFKRVGSGYDHPPSVALLSSQGDIIWEVYNYTVGGVTYSIDSIWATLAIGDIDNDGSPEIVVGMGADEAYIIRGGLLALNNDGSLQWYFETDDKNWPGTPGNGIPDGIRSSAAIADLNNDGRKEVLVGAGDTHFYVIDGPTGTVVSPWPQLVLDTTDSSPAVADLEGTGQQSFVFGIGIGGSPENCLGPGGILWGMRYDKTYLPGAFSTRLDCNPWVEMARGVYVDQVIFSSPAIGDIDGDGKLEIAVGSGNFFASLGKWVKIFENDGTLLKTLTTDDYVLSSPALADLNSDGYLDIIAATLSTARVYAWSGRPSDNFTLLSGWGNQAKMSNGVAGPIFSSPVVADINPGSAGPEILIGNGAEITVFAANGTQLTADSFGSPKPTFWLGQNPTASTPAIADIDEDGTLEIVAAGGLWDDPGGGGSTDYNEYVFVWHWPGVSGNAAGANLPWPQFRQNAANLGRVPVPAKLAANPVTIQHRYGYGSGAPTTISGSFSLLNLGDESLSYSLSQVSTIPFAFTSPTTGTLGPQASTSVGYTLSVASLITGTYPTTVTVSATAGGSPADGSPQTIIIEAIVGTFEDVFLPIILKNR